MPQQLDAEQLSDHELVARTLADPQLFRFLVQRYQAKLLRYIQRISGVSVQEAEDVLQETFISAYTHLNDIDSAISFSSWIYRIAHNTTISAYRKRKARPEGNMAWDMDDACVEQLIANTDITAQMDRTLLRERVQVALAY